MLIPNTWRDESMDAFNSSADKIVHATTDTNYPSPNTAMHPARPAFGRERENREICLKRF
jgi:hypothetical protein